MIAPAGHPLTQAGQVTLADVAAYPLITYDAAFTGRSSVDAALRAAEVQPVIRMTAMDADVIKTYVGLGMGLGILTEMALDDDADDGIVVLNHDAALFEKCFVKIAVRRGKLLRSFAYRFIELFAPHLDGRRVSAALERGRPFLLDQEQIPPWSEWVRNDRAVVSAFQRPPRPAQAGAARRNERSVVHRQLKATRA